MVEYVSPKKRKKGRKERKKEKFSGIQTHTSCLLGKCTTTVLWESHDGRQWYEFLSNVRESDS